MEKRYGLAYQSLEFVVDRRKDEKERIEEQLVDIPVSHIREALECFSVRWRRSGWSGLRRDWLRGGDCPRIRWQSLCRTP